MVAVQSKSLWCTSTVIQARKLYMTCNCWDSYKYYIDGHAEAKSAKELFHHHTRAWIISEPHLPTHPIYAQDYPNLVPLQPELYENTSEVKPVCRLSVIQQFAPAIQHRLFCLCLEIFIDLSFRG